MTQKPKPTSAHRGTFHNIATGVGAFEPEKPPSDAPDYRANAILHISGLFDTLGHVTYPFLLASSLPPSWTLYQLSLNSAGTQWGAQTLDDDADDLALAVAHFRDLHPGRIVLMGHSTGCQDSIHYATAPPTPKSGAARPPVDAIILQAPVSDKEALLTLLGAARIAEVNAAATSLVKLGTPDDCLPMTCIRGGFFPGPFGLSARRWLSLTSPDGTGQDDYFSSDLSDARHRATFGRIPRGTGVLFVYSGEDVDFLGEGVDVPAMLARWKGFAEGAGAVVDPVSTTLLEGASHNLNHSPDDVRQELVRRVLGFLPTVGK